MTLLYVWRESDTLTPGQDAAFTQWLASRPQQGTPLLQIQPVRTSATQAQPAPVAEESKAVYRMQLVYPGQQDAGNRRYFISRDNQQIDEGRSDAQGFTRAHNADYDEIWGTTLMNN